MASTMFESTYAAYQEITKTFDIIWALDAGLWNLRTGAQKFYSEHPNATESQAKDELIYGLQIHGINLKRIANCCEEFVSPARLFSEHSWLTKPYPRKAYLQHRRLSDLPPCGRACPSTFS